MFESIARALAWRARRRPETPQQHAKRVAREKQDWYRRQQLRPVGRFGPVRPAPPKRTLTPAERRARRLSTRESRRRAHRAASLAASMQSGRAS